jgi:hypothetical protein
MICLDISLLIQREANLRQRSMSRRSPSSSVDVASSGAEHNHDHGPSGIEKTRNPTKRPRKEPQQRELILAERLVDVSTSEMDISLTTLCESPERNHAPYYYSRLSRKNNIEVVPNRIDQTVTDQEIVLEVLLDGQLSAPSCRTGAGSACNTLSIAEARKKKTSACKNSAGIQERLLSVKALKVKKGISNSKGGKTHPIQQLQGIIASDNVSPCHF